MRMKSTQHYQVRAEIAKAIAHPSRLLILDVLRNRSLCVGELTQLVGADQSTVSKHLTILKKVGLVTCHKRGLTMTYRLECSCLTRFFDCLESVLVSNLKKQESGVRG